MGQQLLGNIFICGQYDQRPPHYCDIQNAQSRLKSYWFLLDSPHADLEEDIRIQLPIGFQVDGQTEADSKRHYILKLNKMYTD